MTEPDPISAPARRHLGLGAAASLAVQVAPLVGVTVLSVAVARHLGPSGTGAIALLTVLFEVLLAIFGFGLTVGTTYLVSRGEWSVRNAFREGQGAALLLGVAGVATGLVFFALTQNQVFAGISLVSAVLGVAHLPFAIGRALTGAIALARERYEAYASLELARTAVLIAVGVPLVLMLDLNGALIGLAAASVAGYLAATVWAIRYGRVAPVPVHAHPGRLREAAAFGSKAWGASLLQLVNYRLDLFLLALYVSHADVGRYSVALSVTALGWILPAALETVIFPRTADLHGAHLRGEIAAEESDRATVRAIRHSVILLVPATIAVLLLVVVAIPVLYGSEFGKSVWLGLILTPGVIGLALGKSVSAVVTGRGRPHYALWTVAITVPLTIVLYLTLIPLLGAYGAALGSTVSYLTSMGLGLFWFKRTTHIPFRAALVPSAVELRDYVDALATVRRRLRPRPAAP